MDTPDLDKDHWQRAYQIALRVLRSPSLASDAAQDALLRVHESKGKYEIRDFNAWFYRVSYTSALRYVTSAWARHRSKEELDSERIENTDFAPDVSTAAALLSQCMNGCLEELNDEDRELFVDRYINGVTDREVADKLGIKTNTAKQRAFRARKRLRECVVHTGCAEDPEQEKKQEPPLADAQCVPCDLGGPAQKGKELVEFLKLLGGNWNVVDEHHLEKRFEFSDFAEAHEFTNRVGYLAETEGHHPQIELSWGLVVVRTFTMKADGLTKSDFVLAAKIDHTFELMSLPSDS